MSETTKKLISLVIPAYKEEKNVDYIYRELLPILEWIQWYQFEILFVNDWSPDDTWYQIELLCNKDTRVKWVDLSRNFGKEIAITAGLQNAKWDAVITIDADGQHPVEKIPEFIQEWETGYDIVYNTRPITEDATYFKRKSSEWFYRIFNNISEFKLEPGTTDYRLLDRKVVNSFLRFSEKNRMYRGLVDWLGYNKKALVFDAKSRVHGEASYDRKMLIKLAINSLTSFSTFPIRLIGWFGTFMVLFAGVLLIYVLFDKFTIDKFQFSNIAAIMLGNTILIGVVLIAISFIGVYIANIHEEVIGRPLFIVKDKINI